MAARISSSLVPRMKVALIVVGLLWLISIGFSVAMVIGAVPAEDDPRMIKALVWVFPIIVLTWPYFFLTVWHTYLLEGGALTFKSVARNRRILLSEVERVRIYLQNVNGELLPFLAVESGGRKFHVSGYATNADLFRESLLASVDPGKVIDERGKAVGA
jgi:hypothetical protein